MSGLRVAVTGANGYLGRTLVHRLAADPAVESILGLDIRAAEGFDPARVKFVRHDVRCPFGDLLREARTNCAVHLAFIVDPLRDTREMQSVNLGGTSQFFAACEQARVARVLVASSASAYGAHRDNPVPLEEHAVLRGNHDYQYAWEKVLLEAQCWRFAAAHPSVDLKVVRPAIVLGPNVNNYIASTLLGPRLIGVLGADPPMQFVHEDDVARAVHALLGAGAPGPYNLGAPGLLHRADIARVLGRRELRLPGGVLRCLLATAWHLGIPGIPPTPPGILHFIESPLVVATQRIEREIGFGFEYSSKQTLRAFAEANR